MSPEISAQRERTIRWSDPKELEVSARGVSGIEFLTKIFEGRLPPPPVAQLIDFAFEEISEGKVIGSIVPKEFHYNPIGTMHGGIIATVLDSVMGCAVHTRLPAARGYTTLEIKVNFLRPVTELSGYLRAIGNVIHLGSRTAMAEGRLEDSSGRIYAHATTTCLVFDVQT